MKNYFVKVVLAAFIALSTQAVTAQQLECDGGAIEGSVSIKMSGDYPSARVIVKSTLELSYNTSMGPIPKENIFSGIVDGLYTDTLYFFVTDPYATKRRLTISAEGFASVEIPDLNLKPKATYSFVIFDPSGSSVYSARIASATNAAQSHKYAAAIGFYKQALVAEDAPEDLSPVEESIAIMEECSKYDRYGKACLKQAKDLKDAGGVVDVDKVKELYSEARKCFVGIQNYMNDEKYKPLISKIDGAIASLPLVVAGVVEDAANTQHKLQGVKVYGMTSSEDKSPRYLTTTNASGEYHIELSSSDKKLYKYLMFDPSDIKGFRKPKLVGISSITDHTKFRVKIYK